MTDAVSQAFLAALEQHLAIKHVRTTHKDACRAWNKARAKVAGWPDVELTVPCYRQTWGSQPPLPNSHGMGPAVPTSLTGRRADVPYIGFDMPLLDPKPRMLAELLADTSGRILYAAHLEGDGPEIYERACAMGLEGIVTKQRDAPYRSGRIESWIKVKCGTYPIVAFVEKLGVHTGWWCQ